MQNQSRNIYQIPRISIGYTQEKASELLYISVESLRAYETGRTIPPNDVVSRMIGIYNAPYLAYQHIMYSSEVARQCLPAIDIKELPAAILNLQVTVEDFLCRQNDLAKIGCDGVIAEDEQGTYDDIVRLADCVVAAIYGLKYAKQKEQ